MDTHKPNLMAELEERKKYHEEQLRQIKIALAALHQGSKKLPSPASTQKSNIKWTESIKRIFKEADGETLSPAEVCRQIMEQEGPYNVPENYASVVHNTIGRLFRRGLLEKPELGKYKWKRQRLGGEGS